MLKKVFLECDYECIYCGGSRATKGFCKACNSKLHRGQLLGGKSREELIEEYIKRKGYQIKGQFRLEGVKNYDVVEATDKDLTKRQLKYLNLREDAFSLPLSREAQYFVGLMVTDGNVRYENGRPRMELALTDGDIIYKFANFLGIPEIAVEVRDRTSVNCKNVYRLRFTSQKIMEDLNRLGVVPRKSEIIDIVEELRLSPDFIRGVIDGDGSISINKNNLPTVSIMSGSRDFIETLGRSLSEMSFDSGTTTLKFKNNVYSRYIKGGKSEVVRFLRYIYPKDCISMDRKRNKAWEIINQFDI